MKLLVLFAVFFTLAVNFISYTDALEDFSSYEEPQFEDVDMEPAGYVRRRSVPYNLPEESLIRRARQNAKPLNPDCTLEECTRLGPGFYGLKQCSNIYCRCWEDNARTQSCPEGLVFPAQIGICIDKNLAKETGYCKNYFKASQSTWRCRPLPIISLVFLCLVLRSWF